MSMWFTPRCESASTTAFWMGGRRADRAGLADALRAQGFRGLSVSVFDVS